MKFLWEYGKNILILPSPHSIGMPLILFRVGILSSDQSAFGIPEPISGFGIPEPISFFKLSGLNQD